jgi:transposase
MAIKLRELTDEEKAAITKLTRPQTAAAREVKRAQIILLASNGKRVPAIAQELELTEITVRTWLKRFNNQGLDGLTVLPRSGRPVTYSAEQVAKVIALVLSDPQQLGQPFACCTLDRLERYLNN